MSRTILIVGGSSAIGRALASRLAAQNHGLVLAGRDRDDLERTAADLSLRFAVPVKTAHFEAGAYPDHRELFAPLGDHGAGTLDGIIVCHGITEDQAQAEANPLLAVQMTDVNYTSTMSVLEHAAAYFETRRHGMVVAISSVAGDRGRRSNYLYGATKAALNCCMEGLRCRLAKAGVAVLTVKPGFVDTAMTWGRPGLFLVASPERVARDIARALTRGTGGTIYTPWFWRWIMLIIRCIPGPVFRRLKL